jgi:hypothetical protein
MDKQVKRQSIALLLRAPAPIEPTESLLSVFYVRRSSWYVCRFIVRRSGWYVRRSGWYASGWYVRRSGWYVRRSSWYVCRRCSLPSKLRLMFLNKERECCVE